MARPGTPRLARRLAAEGVGLLPVRLRDRLGDNGRALSDGNDAVALLANTIATGAILFVLITMLGPISGAHMNLAVTLGGRLAAQARLG